MGFENNFYAPDGTLLPDNAASVAMQKTITRPMDRDPDPLEKLDLANTV